MNTKYSRECTAEFTEEVVVESIVDSIMNDDEPAREEAVEEDVSVPLPSRSEQLKAIGLVKRLFDEHPGSLGIGKRAIHSLQRAIRLQGSELTTQSRMDSYFANSRPV